MRSNLKLAKVFGHYSINNRELMINFFCGRARACVKLSTVMSQILITVDNFTQARAAARARRARNPPLVCTCIVQRFCRETCEKVYTNINVFSEKILQK